MIMSVLRDGTIRGRFGLLTFLANAEAKTLTIVQGCNELDDDGDVTNPEVHLNFDASVTLCGALALASATGDLISTRREFGGYARFHPVFVVSQRDLSFIEVWQEHPATLATADPIPPIGIGREEIASVIQVIGDLL